ncbi:unnamed protein product [Gadus morhua 'NCC']
MVIALRLTSNRSPGVAMLVIVGSRSHAPDSKPVSPPTSPGALTCTPPISPRRFLLSDCSEEACAHNRLTHMWACGRTSVYVSVCVWCVCVCVSCRVPLTLV